MLTQIFLSPHRPRARARCPETPDYWQENHSVQSHSSAFILLPVGSPHLQPFPGRPGGSSDARPDVDAPLAQPECSPFQRRPRVENECLGGWGRGGANAGKRLGGTGRTCTGTGKTIAGNEKTGEGFENTIPCFLETFGGNGKTFPGLEISGDLFQPWLGGAWIKGPGATAACPGDTFTCQPSEAQGPGFGDGRR
jgi:hypothetical protein